MKVVHVARTPLAGTVARTALKHGSGGLNISRSRIRYDSESDKTPVVGHGEPGQRNPGCGPTLPSRKKNWGRWEVNHTGRWPANLILSHKQGCRRVGNTSVPGNRIDTRPEGDGGRVDKSQWRFRPTEATRRGYSDDDGNETVAVWECVKGCPVAALGGVSRYFRQAQEQASMTIPAELQSYLCEMIGTPEAPGLYVPNITNFDTAKHADGSVPGLIIANEPTPEQAKELMRILMPGAHLLLVAPGEEPTGHTGACIIEDTGFEIRDAILWAQEGEKLHYVPKTARKEREAGCHDLKGKTGAAAVERKEDTAGLNSPRAGAGRTASHVKNFHPTVKPIALMERLLDDVPKDAGPVLDPFMGSGTTGIACTRTGHSFIGIEMGEEYLEIADTRIRYWDSQKPFGRKLATVVSDHEPPPEEETDPAGAADFFGFGED